MVQPLAERLDLARRLDDYARHRWQGEGITGPALHLDDFSGIPFLVDITGVELYQHRARLRARAGDLYVAATPTSTSRSPTPDLVPARSSSQHGCW